MGERITAMNDRLEQVVAFLHGHGPLPPLMPPDTPPTPSLSSPSQIEAAMPALTVSSSDWHSSPSFRPAPLSPTFSSPAAVDIPGAYSFPQQPYDATHSSSAPAAFDTTWSLPPLSSSFYGGFGGEQGTSDLAGSMAWSPMYISPAGSLRGPSRSSRSPAPGLPRWM